MQVRDQLASALLRRFKVKRLRLLRGATTALQVRGGPVEGVYVPSGHGAHAEGGGGYVEGKVTVGVDVGLGTEGRAGKEEGIGKGGG